MKLHISEIIILSLALAFMIAVTLQAYYPQSQSEPVMVFVETSCAPDAMLTGGDGESAGEGVGLININTADSDMLSLLPGIGKSLADRIIEYRKANGIFNRIEDITNVSGIGEKTFEAIKFLIICKEDIK